MWLIAWPLCWLDCWTAVRMPAAAVRCVCALAVLPLAALRVMRGAKVHSATSAAASAAACSSRSAAARSRKSSVSTPCAAIRRLRWLMRGWKVGYLVLPEHNGWLPLRVSTVKEK